MLKKQQQRIHIEHTGHLTTLGDHLKIFESTIVDVHELSSSRRIFPVSFFVQVLQLFELITEKILF